MAMLLAVMALVPANGNIVAQEAPTTSTNLSASGSASLPAIGIAPNGRLHALWWDQLDGTRYARGATTLTETVWSNSVLVPGIAGLRRVDQNTRAVTLKPPVNLQLQVDGAGVGHATWFDDEGQLLYSQVGTGANANWTAPTVLAAGAAGVAMTLDISGTLRIALIQTSNTAQSPSGVYYLTRAGNAFRRSLAYASTYFRTARPEEVNMSVASDGDNAIVAWYQAREGGSFSVRTNDAASTWSQPEPVVPRGESVGVPIRVAVGVEAPGKFLLMWRDASAPGCGLFQKVSADAGQTWGTPQRVLTSLSRCPEWWQMVYVADGQTALLGTPSTVPTADVQSGLLAFWNGSVWSQPADVILLYQDPGANVVQIAGCIDLALAGTQLATIGCDTRGDVWANVRLADASAAAEAGATAWQGNQLLTAQTSANLSANVRDAQDVSVIADQSGAAYAVWAMSTEPGKPAATLQMTSLTADRWSEPKDIMRISTLSKPDGVDSVVQTTAPSLAVGGDGKLHLVWSGGESGRVFYSSAFTRDALDETRWTSPVMLPAPSPIGSSPHIHANLETGLLSVLFTVPFNEGRGVYLTQSTDGGANWLTPTKVFDAMAAGWDAVGQSRLAFDPAEGVFHAVWMKTPLPGASGDRELYYARSENGGRAWSQPVRIDDGQIESPHIEVIGPNNLMLTWHKQATAATQDNAPWQVWWQASPFGGERWTPPAILTGFDRVSGESGLGTDGAGRAYLGALGQGISGEASLLYAEWDGTQWSRPEVTSLSQPAAAGNSAALAVLNNAKQLQNIMRLSIVRQDGQREYGVATTSRTVEASEVQPLPTFTPVPARAESTPVAIIESSTPAPTTAVLMNTAPASGGDMPSFILLGAGLALVVLIGGIALSLIITRRR